MDKNQKKFMGAIRQLDKSSAEDVIFKYQYDNPESYFYLRDNGGKSGIKLTKVGGTYSLSLWNTSACGIYEDISEKFSLLNKYNQGMLACLYNHLEKEQEKERELINQKEMGLYNFKWQEDELKKREKLFHLKKKKFKKDICSKTCSVEDRV